MTDFEKILTSLCRIRDKAISRFEGQISQLTSFKSESPKGTFPSQSVTNHRNSSQAHMAQEDTMNQCNVVHTL